MTAVALRLDYDFNMPPDADGLYRVLPHEVVLNHQEPGDAVVFGSDGCWAKGVVIGWEMGRGGPLVVVERHGLVDCE